MADARHTIEIILQARDRTAAAFASAIGNQKAFEAITKESERSSKSFADAQARIADQLNTTKKGLAEARQEWKRLSDEAITAELKLEQAARRHAQAQGNASASDAQRAAAVRDLIAAREAYSETLTKATEEEKKWSSADAARRVNKIAGLAAEEERVKQLSETHREAAKIEREEAEETARQRKALFNELDRVEREIDSNRQKRMRETQAELDRLERKERENALNRQRFMRELDRVEREITSRRAQSSRELLAEQNRLERAQETRANKEKRDWDDLLAKPRRYLDLIQQIRRLEDERKRAEDDGDRVTLARVELDADRAKREAAELAVGLRALLGHIEANVDVDGGKARAEALALKAQINAILGHVELEVDVDTRRLSRARFSIREFTNDVSNNFHNASQAVSSFDNFMRGLMVLAIATFLNQIVLLAGAAAGALLGLASSALTAGAALGGALVAGANQAIPVLGILFAAAARVKAVMDAVNQAQLLQQQQSYQGAQANNRMASTTDAVRSAQERLADSHRRVAQAQIAVNDAREEARRKLEDLILAERGASLSVEESQAALRRAVASGDTSAIARAQLSRDEAELRANRTKRELSERRTAGIEGSPEVAQAKEGLRDAERAANQASRALAGARRNADIAGANITAAAGKLNFLLGEMSDAERRMYEALMRLQETWRAVSQNVTEPLIDAFTYAINRVRELLLNDALVGAARQLSGRMATQFRRVFDAFTSPEMIEAWIRLMDEAGKNMKPLADIAIDLGNAFMDIAEAAGPALREIIDWIGELVDRFAEWTASAEGRNTLADVFEKGVDHLKAWVNLLGQIGQLFIAIAGPGGGAKAGLDMVNGMADAIGRWADQISTKGTKANEFFTRFFELTKEMLSAMGPVLTAIAEEFDKTFSKDGVSAIEGFASFLADILIPAFGDFIRTMGEATSAVGDFLTQHPLVTKMVSSFLALLMVGNVILRLGTVLKPITAIVSGLAKQLDKVFGISQKVLPLLTRAPLAMTGWGLVAGAVLLLLERMGLLDDLLNALKRPFVALWETVKPGIENIVGAFKELGDAIGGGGGLFDIIRPFAKFLIDVLGAHLETVGKIIGNAIVTPLNVLADAIKIVVRLFQGDFSGALEALGDLGQHVVDGFLAPFKAIWDYISEVFNKVVDLVKDIFGISSPSKVFSDIGDAIVEGFVGAITALPRLAWNTIKDGFNEICGLIRGLGSHLIRAFWNGIQAAWDFVKRLPNRVWNVIKNGFGDFWDLYKGLGSRLIRMWWEGIKAQWNFVTGLVGKIWDGIKAGVEWLWDKIKQFGGTLIKLWWEGIKAQWNFVTNLPEKIWQTLSDGIHELGPKLLDLGKRIVEAIIKGIKSAPGALKSALGDIIPSPGDVVDTAGKALPWNWNKGGAVPGYGGGDIVPSMLEPGEHVLTKDEVRNAGGHGAIFALRRMLGGGTQSRSRGYQQGGAVRGRGAAAMAASVAVTSNMGDFAEQWSEIWESIADVARRQTNRVAVSVEDLRTALNRSMQRLVNMMDASWKDITKITLRSANRMVDGVRESVNALTNTIYRGMRYIGNSTNDALKAFDASPLKFSIDAPGKAVGGWIGSAGERGEDRIPVVLGRGEAVLNWAHQKVVNSALWNQYGTTLDGLFKGTRALHAGGHGQPGLATGGYTGPGGSGAGFTPVWNLAKNKFGMTNFTGYAGHSYYTSSGNVSDHAMHRALDMAMGTSHPTPQLDALNSFILHKIPQTIKQLIWRDKDQTRGFPVGGHMDHIHFAMPDQFAFNGSLMARIISRASRGLSIDALLRGVTGDGVEIDHVDRQKVKGDGPLRQLAQKILDKVMKAANRYIDKRANLFSDSAWAMGLKHGEPYDGPLNRLFPQHFLENPGAQLSADQVAKLARMVGLPPEIFVPIARGESQFYPGVQQHDPGDGMVGYGLWQMTPNAWGRDSAAYAYMQKLGGISAMFNPYKNALMAKFLYENAASKIPNTRGFPWYGTQYLAGGGYAGSARPQFAMGGIVPGGEGQAVPITAHAGEWVLNKIQQSKLAQMLGTGVGRLRDALGFTGGPTSFQGGGEVQGIAALTEGRLREEIRHERELKRLADLRRDAQKKNDEEALKKIKEREKEENELHKKRKQKNREAADALAEDMNPERLRRRRARGGDYELDTTPARGPGGIRDEIRRARGANRALGRRGRSGSGLDQRIDNFQAILGEDGLITQLGEAFDRVQTRMQNSLALAQVGLKRVGDKLRSRKIMVSAVDIARENLDILKKNDDHLREERRKIVAEKDRVDTAIRRLRRGGITQEEQSQFEELVALRNRALDRMAELDGEIAENMAQVWETRVEIFQARTEELLKRSNKRLARQEFKGEMASILGNEDAVRFYGEQQLATLREQQEVISERLKRARALRNQDPRWQAEVDSLQEQDREMQLEIARRARELFENQLAAMERGFERQRTAIEFAGRRNDLTERAGDRLGAAQRRIGLSDQLIAQMQGEIQGYYMQALQAQQMGYMDIVQDLQDKVAELQVSIEEEIASRRDLVFAYRQTATDIITGQADRATGLLGVVSDIFQKIGELTGRTEEMTGRLIDAAQRITTELTSEAAKLVQNVNQAIGGGEFGAQANNVLAQLAAAFQSGPESFGTTLANLGSTIAQIEAGMGDSERAVFQALIQSMIDNTTATLENNQQLKDLNGINDIQGFTSAGWRYFRQAIFNGMGGLMPQYANAMTNFPSMDRGGRILSNGYLVGHVGEEIVPAHIARRDYDSRNGDGGDVNVYLTSPTEVADPLAIGKRVMFEKSRTSR